MLLVQSSELDVRQAFDTLEASRILGNPSTTQEDVELDDLFEFTTLVKGCSVVVQLVVAKLKQRVMKATRVTRRGRVSQLPNPDGAWR